MKTNAGKWAMRSVVALAATVALGAAHAVAVTPRVVLDGPAAPVMAGDVFSVMLSGHDFMPIVGGGVNLSFSADLIEWVSVSFDPAWSFYVDAGTVDNAAGTVTDMSFNLFGTMQGSFAIATIDFRAKAAGSANIDLLDSEFFPFADMNAQVVPVSFESTSVQVASVVPEPSTWLMMLGGFGLLALTRRGSAAKS
jgi:hypothetical protein